MLILSKVKAPAPVWGWEVQDKHLEPEGVCHHYGHTKRLLSTKSHPSPWPRPSHRQLPSTYCTSQLWDTALLSTNIMRQQAEPDFRSAHTSVSDGYDCAIAHPSINLIQDGSQQRSSELPMEQWLSKSIMSNEIIYYYYCYWLCSHFFCPRATFLQKLNLNLS